MTAGRVALAVAAACLWGGIVSVAAVAGQAVTCPSCGKQVPRAPNCNNCGKPLASTPRSPRREVGPIVFVPFDTKHIPDPNLSKGQQRPKRAGKRGSYRTITISVFRNGRWVVSETSKDWISRPIDAEVWVGAKDDPAPPPPPPPEESLRFSQVSIAFRQRPEYDSDLPEGERIIKQRGSNGSYEECWVSGRDESGVVRERRDPTRDRNRIEPIDEIVVIGTKPLPTARQMFESAIANSGRLATGGQAYWTRSGVLLFQGSNLGEAEVYRAALAAPSPVAIARGSSFSYCEETELLYFVTTAGDTSKLGVCRADGSDRNLDLIRGAGRCWQPVPSPDGKHLAFLSDRDGDPDVFVSKANGTEIVNASYAAGAQWWPRWSPDGKRLICLTSAELGTEIAMLSPDGSQWETLTRSGGKKAFPEWSNDGNSILFWGEANGQYMLHALNCRTREVRSIAGARSDKPTPILWHSDSTLAYCVRWAAGQSSILKVEPGSWTARSVLEAPSIQGFALIRGSSEVGVIVVDNGKLAFKIAQLR